MDAPLEAGRCIYMDDKGPIFSLSAFIEINGLPDHPQLRAVIVEEVREIFPDIRILEELN